MKNHGTCDKQMKCFLLFMLFGFIVNCFCQNSDVEFVQIPRAKYTVPYEIPTEAEITEILERVRDYFYRQTPYKIVSRTTWDEINDFSVIHPDAIVDYRQGKFNLWVYEMGVVHAGMFLCGEVTRDSKFIDYPLKNYDFIFSHLPYFRKKSKMQKPEEGDLKRILKMTELDHCGSIGSALIQAYEISSDERYREMIDTVANFILYKQFRLEDGMLARRRPYQKSIWTDDMYMSIPFLSNMAVLTQDAKYFDEAVQQILKYANKMFQHDKGLFDHGLNLHVEYDPKMYWARANGWAIMAIVELLSDLPENYTGREKIIKILNSHVQGITEYQSGKGMWHNLIDKPDTYLESSATAMFIYCIARAINRGWIDYTYAMVAITGWNALITNIKENGQIENICRGTTFANDMVYYYHRPTTVHALHGYGPTLLAGAELINLLRNDNFYIKEQNATFYFHPKESD